MASVALSPPLETPETKTQRLRWLSWISWLLTRSYRFTALCVLLAIAASMPIVQLAALGYLLEVARRRAVGRPWREALPGLALAGNIGWIALAMLFTWLPVYFSLYFAYQAELIEPQGEVAARWRVVAIVVGLAWLVHVAWSLMRGGRWRDFLWPAPRRFLREFFRPSAWHHLEDRLWEILVGLRLPTLLWLGFRGWIGALIWLFIPGLMIVIGMQSYQQPLRGLIGVLGFFAMWLVLLYLPFLQVEFAKTDRFRSLFQLQPIRQSFQRAPWAFLLATLLTLGLAVPLYLLRIETLPSELLWLPCVVFVLFTLPAKLSVGWAMRRGEMRREKRWWVSRYAAWFIQLAIVPGYILFLYLGSIASWEGAGIVILQHAFLVPVPFGGQ